jgi:hypothetical protein
MIRDALYHRLGRLLLGLLLLFVGGYYFLRNTLGFDLGELDGEALWPVVVIVFGALLLLRGFITPTEPSGS